MSSSSERVILNLSPAAHHYPPPQRSPKTFDILVTLVVLKIGTGLRAFCCWQRNRNITNPSPSVICIDDISNYTLFYPQLISRYVAGGSALLEAFLLVLFIIQVLYSEISISISVSHTRFYNTRFLVLKLIYAK